MDEGEGPSPHESAEGVAAPLQPEDLILRSPVRTPSAKGGEAASLRPEDLVLRNPVRTPSAKEGEAASLRPEDLVLRNPVRTGPSVEEGESASLSPDDLVLRNPEPARPDQPAEGDADAPLRPEDLVLKNQERYRPLTRPPKKPAPLWLKHARPILAVVVPLVGLLMLVWRFQPENPFHPPPDSIEVVNVRVAEHEGLPVLQGDVSNKSGRAARRVTYKVEYRLDGQDRSSFVVVQNVPNEATVTFSVPLIRSQPDGVSVVGPAESDKAPLPRLEGTPKFTPYDSQW